MKINILLSTIDNGISNIKNVVLPKREDVEYIISHQYTSEKYKAIPEELKRDDVMVSQIPGRGVTKSRNNAIRLATGDIGLFADDDVEYENGYFDIIKSAFNQYPEADIALFKIKTEDGEPEYKAYPDKIIYLKKTLYSISTLEIAVDIQKIRQKGLIFDERFGVGQENIIGSEETIFVEDALQMGLHVIYFPEYVSKHPYTSTVNSIPQYDKRRNWVAGAYDCRKNGIIAVPKAFLGTIKYFPDIIKKGGNPLLYFIHRLSAAIYILCTNWKYKKLPKK